jgi:hypothetical protein
MLEIGKSLPSVGTVPCTIKKRKMCDMTGLLSGPVSYRSVYKLSAGERNGKIDSEYHTLTSASCINSHSLTKSATLCCEDKEKDRSLSMM